MKSWVLDAGVAAKWYLADEPLIHQAEAVFDSFSKGRTAIIVPNLFWPEFGNTLWKAERRGRISSDDAKRAISSLTAKVISTVPSRSLLSRAWAIAQAHGRTVYDATYVALAAQTGHSLLTADEKLVNPLGTAFPVCWLGSMT